ncbi:MAG: hypothetical protein ACXVAX_03365 [Pseudobdellovibrio sp.]
MNILHYFKLKPSQREILHLNSGLKNYGLSPEEWTLIPDSKNSYQIINTQEPDFIFRGETKKFHGRRVWKKIVLRSL